MGITDIGPAALDLSARIQPLLHGQGPAIQGAALCDLVSIFIAGHHPKLREPVLKLFVDFVRALVPESEAQIFPNGKPDGWE
jgi:hypothetical protein